MFDYKEATHLSEDRSNIFTLMTGMIIIPYSLYVVHECVGNTSNVKMNLLEKMQCTREDMINMIPYWK